MKFNKVTPCTILLQVMKRSNVNINEIAKERCERLILLAKEMYTSDALLSRRYITLARAIAMRHRLKLGRKLFCKKCNSVFISGVTVITRIDMKRKERVLTCKNCGSKIIMQISKKFEKNVD